MFLEISIAAVRELDFHFPSSEVEYDSADNFSSNLEINKLLLDSELGEVVSRIMFLTI